MEVTAVIQQIEEAIADTHRGADTYMAASIAADRIMRMREPKGFLTARGQFYGSMTAMPQHERESAIALFA